MNTLHDALEAMNKATPGPLAVQESRDGGCTYSIIAYDGRGAYVTASVNTFSESSEGIANAKEYAAAPTALAWIKEALPWIKKRAEVLRTLLILARAENDKEAYAELIADASEELAALDTLLAQAKGDNHAEG